ncbi:MAG: hypothetical protein AABZ47_12645, partial [Planctomycetota bacterium]
YDTCSVHPDFYSAVTELAAFSTWGMAANGLFPNRNRWLAAIAGLLFATATSMRQTGCLALLVITMTVGLFALIRRGRETNLAIALAWTWLGWLVGIAGVVGILAYQTSLAAAYEAIVTFNESFITSDAIVGAFHSWFRARMDLAPVSLPLWLGMVGFVSVVFRRKTEPRDRLVLLILITWWFAAIFLALAGPSKSTRYWLGAFPPMICAAAIGLHELHRVLKTHTGNKTALVLIAITLTVMLGRPLAEQHIHGIAQTYLDAQRNPSERDRLRELSETLSQAIPEGNRIYVWAYDPGLYMVSNRASACRFTYPRSEVQMNEILQAIENATTKAVVTRSPPAPEFVQWCTDDCATRLAAALVDYRKTTTIHGYTIWLRP